MAESFRVRKGTWTGEEDDLLRKCIEEYGEAKWHQVPLRAGLNRCRKSCRLRWLNYLKPNIKRGEFAADEVDLILRLHKLLGNRWSLIAGRLPGRTANDVKNFWNTHLRKKADKCCKNNKEMEAKPEEVKKINIIKPQPRTFAKNSPWLKGKGMTSNNLQLGDYNLGKQSTPSDHHHHQQQQQQENDTDSVWWESFLLGDELDQPGISSSLGWPEEEATAAKIFAEKSPMLTRVKDSGVIEAGRRCTTDHFSFDPELWDLLNAN